MTEEEIKKKVEDLRMYLKEVEVTTKALQEENVNISFNVSSEQKTVDFKASTFFEIKVKVTINQEL